MQTVEAVEYRQRGLQGVAIIKGTHVRIAIGLWVDGASEVILGTDTRIHIRKKTANGTRLVGLVVVKVECSPLHLVVVLHGILHTLLHRPLLRL